MRALPAAALPLLALVAACTPTPADDSGAAPCAAATDDDDSPEDAVALPCTDAGAEHPSLDAADEDWYRHTFYDQEWWNVSVEPDDPEALEVRITVLDEDMNEIQSSTTGVAWGWSRDGDTGVTEPVLRYLRAEAVRGCGTYGFSTFVL